MKLVKFNVKVTDWHVVECYSHLEGAEQYENAIDWCFDYPSEGRFSLYLDLALIYIERDEDYTMFLLTHNEDPR